MRTLTPLAVALVVLGVGVATVHRAPSPVPAPVVPLTRPSAGTVAAPPAARAAVPEPAAAPAAPVLVGDALDTVEAWAPRALEGDARASYRVGAAVRKCSAMGELYKLTGEVPEDWADCARYLAGDPFAALPPRAGGYPWQFWHEAALRADDPLAVLVEAYEHVETMGAPRDELEHAVELVEASHDAEALAMLAQMRAAGAL